MSAKLEKEEGYLDSAKKLYLARPDLSINRLSYILLDISGNCNLNCGICSFPKWYEKRGQMSLETVNRLDKTLRRLSSVNLNCNCEPLLNRDLIKIIKLIKKKNRDIYTTFSTNGTLLHKSLIYKLLKSGLNGIQVSIDSLIKKNYENIRMGASFDDVIANVKNLVLQRRRCINSLKDISIIAVATKENVHELGKILDLAKKLGIDRFLINGLEPYSRKYANKILYGKKVNSKFRKAFLKLQNKANKHKMELRLPSLKTIRYNSCFLQGCAIDWNGDVHPCAPLSYRRPYYYLRKLFIHPKITFGNVNKQKLHSIWNSRKFRQFRRSLSIGNFSSYCKNCLLNNNVICAKQAY